MLRPLLLASLAASALSADTAAFQLTTDPVLPDAAPLPPRFIGLSIEVGSTPSVFNVGGLGGSPRRSLATLLNTLRTTAGDEQGPNIRVGGNSADESAWVPSGPLPVNTTYRITAADLAAYAAAVALWNGTITLDTTLRYPDQATPLVTEHVKAALRALGQGLEKVELGNEPDLFFENGIRSPSYFYPNYTLDYGKVFSSVVPLLPRAMVQGATWCSERWAADFPDYMARWGATMSSVSIHRYAETACRGAKPTMAGLLADKSSLGLAAGVAHYVATAAEHRVPVFIGEGNSISCGGYAGVSDAWGAALWVVDALFAMAAVGIQRWNFHGMPGGPYAVFDFPSEAAEDAQVRPIFYGLLGFARAVGGGRAVQRKVRALASTNPLIKCWAVSTPGGGARVVLIHKDAAASGDATVTITPAGQPSATGSLVRGLPGAEGVDSKWDSAISLAGLSWATTLNGVPAGQEVSEPVQVVGGKYQVRLPPASFAVLDLPA